MPPATSIAAIDYATRAGQRADALLAFEDAVQFFQTALDCMEQRRAGRARRAAGCCCCSARRSARPTTFRMRWRRCSEPPRSRRRSARRECARSAALAYEHAAWRVAYAWRSARRHLLEEALRQLPDDQRHAAAQLAGALARALLSCRRRPRRRRAQACARDRDGAPTRRSGGLATNSATCSTSSGSPNTARNCFGYATEMLAAAEQAGNLEIVHRICAGDWSFIWSSAT